ncbi:STAS domain-containing protein [Streptomyces sp. NPDC046759]|uniref:STAS domain-containing protein n=1 Tax=Streptomyces sp. NPDC046759 TaxID=3155019 RepID=UPI0033E2444D
MSDRGTERDPSQAAVLQYERHGVWVVVACGSYDLDSIAPLATALDAAARKYRTVVLDASRVVFADSTFLNLLIRTHHATGLRVAAPPLQVRRLLELTGTDTVLDVRATVEEAVSRSGAGSLGPETDDGVRGLAHDVA